MPNERPELKRKGICRQPSFDVASHLLPKYKNLQMTDGFPLEKLCIAELGLKDVWTRGDFVREDYRDIACIPLPGVPPDTVSVCHPDEKYTKAARSVTRDYPITPLYIPSMPQHNLSDC